MGTQSNVLQKVMNKYRMEIIILSANNGQTYRRIVAFYQAYLTPIPNHETNKQTNISTNYRLDSLLKTAEKNYVNIRKPSPAVN